MSNQTSLATAQAFPLMLNPIYDNNIMLNQHNLNQHNVNQHNVHQHNVNQQSQYSGYQTYQVPVSSYSPQRGSNNVSNTMSNNMSNTMSNVPNNTGNHSMMQHISSPMNLHSPGSPM